MDTTRLIVLLAVASVATGCSRQEAGAAAAPRTASTAANPSTTGAPAAAAPPGTAAQPAARTACAMLTAAEMSSILGTAVAAESDEGGGSTTCKYRPSGRSTPNVEVKITWGDGRAAMMGAGVLRRLEPGINDPLAGLGDEASVVGPMFWVRVGEDLVWLTFTAVDDDVAVAKRIINLMRPRMGVGGK